MPTIAVAIPCHNEAQTIRGVVEAFRAELPEASIHVLDNDSSDGTARIAAAAGAVVHPVPVRGKGAAVRAMFREIDADVVVMVDGDQTYPASRARDLVRPIVEGRADMVVATRLADRGAESFRRGHVFGNRLVARTINGLFGARLSDVLSGYRAFSRRFAKTIPVLSLGFEIETEITVHALQYGVAVIEVPVAYAARPEGSASKLRTLGDGFRVFLTVLRLFKDCRPLLLFGGIGFLLALGGAAAGVAVVREFMTYGQVFGIARAVAAVSACVIGVIAIATGLVLDTLNRRVRELHVLIADQVISSPARAPGRPEG